MTTQFFFQKGIAAEIDIEAYFHIRVTSVRGLNPPQPKDIFTRDWAASDGVDYYIPVTRKHKSSEVTMTIYCDDSNSTTAIAKYRSFCDYIFDGLISYRDTLQNQVVSLIYAGNKPSWYQFVGNNQVVAEITFLNPTGGVTPYE